MKKCKYIIKKDDDLIKFLNNQGISKSKIKSLIKYRTIKINDTVVTKLPQFLNLGDTVTINEQISTDIDIIYEDKNYLVVNKKSGLLTISTSKEKREFEDTLYKQVRKYLNAKHEYAFIVNRIDKETSGIVIFAKNQKLKEKLQSNWNNIVKERKYIAVIEGKVTKPGHIDNYLYEDKMTFSHSTKFGGKRAITYYKPIKETKDYTLLDVDIKTGRKNQIRVHMSEMNHPIVGDKKYKSTKNPYHRLMLHHYEISLIDPLTNKKITFTSPIPKVFYELFNSN